MTPAEIQALHALIKERRRQLGMPSWQVAVEMDVAEWTLQQMAHGRASVRTRQAAAAWLDRHTAPHEAAPDTSGEERT
ncbi:hypothetical protein ACBI99_44860 [Nonomuraea sp. ATR24]|uniref:hypothetical protein n=1 Tax=Nonomuraea sp. ATR24 TaxID=1676744 RepID=UPI0035C041CB